jgi:hypothetical protein
MLPPQTRFRGESSRESEGRADARPSSNSGVCGCVPWAPAFTTRKRESGAMLVAARVGPQQTGRLQSGRAVERHGRPLPPQRRGLVRPVGGGRRLLAAADVDGVQHRRVDAAGQHALSVRLRGVPPRVGFAPSAGLPCGASPSVRMASPSRRWCSPAWLAPLRSRRGRPPPWRSGPPALRRRCSAATGGSASSTTSW